MPRKDIDFHNLHASLRPPRLALAYHVHDDWLFQARRANAVLARVWGGAGDVLLPLKGDPGTAEPELLPFLRLFDPDDVGGHLRTIGDLGVDPGVKAKIIAKYGYEGESPEATWDRVRLERLNGEGNWDAFAKQVDSWCSPYRGRRQEAAEFRPQNLDWPPRHGQSKRGLLTVPATADEQVVVFDLEEVDPFIALMVETRIGNCDEPTRDDCKVVRIPMDEADLSNLVALAIRGDVHGWDLSDRYLEAAGLPLNADLPLSDLLANSPYSHTRRWTVPVDSGYEELPVVCVIGDTAEDHALAMLADRLFKHGAWVPTKLLNSELATTVDIAIHRLGDIPEDHDRPVLVTSLSESIDTISAITERINSQFEMRSVPDGAVVRTGSILRAVPASELSEVRGRAGLADPTAFSVRRTVPVAVADADAEIITLAPLQLPLPDVAQTVGVEVHWQIDVSYPGFMAPPRTAIPSKAFLPSPSTPFPDAVIRVSRSGISYASPNMGFTSSGDPIESRLAQPQLRFPTSDELFSLIAARSGARIERSDAGRRAQNALEMWGSFDAIAQDLTGVTRQILNAFLPTGGKKNGDYGIGYAIRNEGFTSVQDLAERLEIDSAEVRQRLDRLILINVVRRGFLLNCARCRWEAFYRIDQVGQTFTCLACGHISTLTRGRWYEADSEPHIYYALDQVVRDLLNQHGYLPILAAAELGKGAKSVLWSSEFSVIDDPDSIEIDLCLIVDGTVIVGEAKTNGTLKAAHGTQTAAKRLVKAAQILTADQIVLATSKDNWARDTYALVEQAIEANWAIGPRPRLIELPRIG